MSEAQLNNLKGHEFKKGQSGNPKGRPQNRITKMLNAILPRKKIRALKKDLTRDEINTIEKKILQMELPDLQLIAKAEETPAYFKALAMATIIDMKNGKTGTVDKLRDRQYGSIQQDVSVSGLNFSQLLMETGMLAEDEIEDIENEITE